MKKDEKDIAILKERFKQQRIALKVNTRYIKRRLKVLNGEGKRIKKIQENSIPREVFDRTISAMNEKTENLLRTTNERFDRVVDQVRKDIKDLADYKTAQEGKSKLTQFIPWIIAAIALAYTIFKK